MVQVLLTYMKVPRKGVHMGSVPPREFPDDRVVQNEMNFRLFVLSSFGFEDDTELLSYMAE